MTRPETRMNSEEPERGLEPLAFSKRQAAEITRNPTTDLGPTRSILNPATDRVACFHERYPFIQADLDLEYEAHALLKEAIPYCEQVRDFGSRELFVSILESEEEHIDFLEKQKQMIADQGLPNYIQLNSEAAEG